jgi:hypothetical protein
VLAFQVTGTILDQVAGDVSVYLRRERPKTLPISLLSQLRGITAILGVDHVAGLDQSVVTGYHGFRGAVSSSPVVFGRRKRVG